MRGRNRAARLADLAAGTCFEVIESAVAEIVSPGTGSSPCAEPLSHDPRREYSIGEFPDRPQARRAGRECAGRLFGLAYPLPQPTLFLMLHYAVVFLIVAIIAGVLGFGYIAGTAAWIAKILFVVFLVLFLVSLIKGRGPKI